MLNAYRVLDLTNERGFICGKILAELGADVIKIEQPGGDAARRYGPFWKDQADPEKSLSWFTQNIGKRGITLDLGSSEGRAIYRQLVKTADIIVESYPPRYLESLGLGYAACFRDNPGIILTSITAHGGEGPWKDYKAYDLQAQATSGTVYICGYPEEAPQSWGGQQAYYQAGLQAAVGIMLALWQREITGEGQFLSVSIREAMTVLTTNEAPIANWIEAQKIKQRWGSSQEDLSGGLLRWFYPCKDGYIIWRLAVGMMGHQTNALVAWMQKEGMSADLEKEVTDWKAIGLNTVEQPQISHWEEIFARFFITKTKAELFQEALKRSIVLFPMSTFGEVLENEQLRSRNYWVELRHPELGTTLQYPGAIFKSSVVPPTLLRRAPLIGEHNEEIYLKELGYSGEQLRRWMEIKVI